VSKWYRGRYLINVLRWEKLINVSSRLNLVFLFVFLKRVLSSTTLYKNAEFIKENVDNKCDIFILCNVCMIKMSRVNGSKESKYFIQNTVLFYETARNVFFILRDLFMCRLSFWICQSLYLLIFFFILLTSKGIATMCMDDEII